MFISAGVTFGSGGRPSRGVGLKVKKEVAMSETITRRRGHLHVPRQGAPLEAHVADWVAEGIISEAQATRIRERSGAARVQPRVVTPQQAPDRGAELRSYAVEALGYLGGLLAVIAATLLATMYWGDLETAGRLIVFGGVAVGLLVAGRLAPVDRGEAWSRLRAVLWVGATAAVAGFTTVLADEVLELREADLALAVGGTATLVAGLLWLAHRVALQQVAMMVGGMLTASAAMAKLVEGDWGPSLGIWAVGLVWLALGWARVLRPRSMAMALGAVGMIIAAPATMSYDAGIVLALATVAAVVLLAVVTRELPLLAAGALGTLMIVPRAVGEWFPGELTAPFVLLAIGGGLVVLAVWIARHTR